VYISFWGEQLNLQLKYIRKGLPVKNQRLHNDRIPTSAWFGAALSVGAFVAACFL
jgi:hypothetical protein